MKLISLNVGRPRLVEWRGQVVSTGIFKEPREGRVRLRRLNLDGDRQADLTVHGGRDKAVYVYPSEHYTSWQAELPDAKLSAGSFGENFTTEGLTEDVVCVGDTFTVGGCVVQVSQPRQPCSNISRRWERPDLPRRMEENGWTGFYLRVLQTGEVGAGDALRLVERAHPDWTLLRANAVIYDKNADPEEAAELASLQGLSAEWKRMLARKLRKIEAAPGQ